LKVNKVLVIQKKSTFQLQAQEHKEERFIKLLEEGSDVLKRVKLAHEEHQATLAVIKKELEARYIEYKVVWRSQIEGFVEDYDLVIAVGGDGTFLDASHSVKDLPILGVNSASSSSFGHFCIANQANFPQILEAVIKDCLSTIKMLRLQLSLNGSLLPIEALNEVLVAHESPAATTRYFLEIGGAREEHRCSGIYIATPAGSTGSIRSAGARVLAVDDVQFEYFVREPCIRPGLNVSLTKGLLSGEETLKIISQMRTGCIYMDGPHIHYPFTLADELVIKASPNSLNAFVNPEINNIFNSYMQ
jgi:NAD+ kinase